MKLDETTRSFKENFGRPAVAARCPGRANLIGEHVDYTGGFVFPMAIDRSMFFALSEGRRREHRFQCVDHQSVASFEKWSFDPKEPSWARYFWAVLEELKARGQAVGMVDCSFGSDIPIGGGLSSSAALCCGFLTAIDAVFELGLSKPDIALIAQAAEHRIGVRCGIMDQWAVVFGKKGCALLLDCRSMEHRLVELHLEGFELVLFDSKVRHALGDSPYNERRAACERVLEGAKKAFPTAVEAFRDIRPEHLQALRNDAASLDLQRAAYAIGENERVLAAERALKEGRFADFGQKLFESHWALSRAYGACCPETDFMTAFVQERFAADVLGARQVGGGFGGSTLDLIRKGASGEVFEQLKNAHRAHFGVEISMLRIAADDGASLL